MSFNFSRGLRFGALLAGVSVFATAYAQEPAPPPEDDAAASGEIIVTAQRRSESLQKVPMTVNVASGEQIQNLVLTDFKDVQQLSPGLEMTNSDGRRNVATIRGIAFEPDTGGDPAVDIYFNDIAVDAQTVFGAIYDIGQIEILRGPQGIFRGRTSPAGAITLATKQANLFDIEGYVQGSVTTKDAINAQGGVSLPLIPGKLAMRVAALADFNRGGSVRRLDGTESSNKTMSGRVSFAFEPSDGFRANLMYQYFHSDLRPFQAMFGPGNQPFALLGDPVSTGPALTIADRRSIGTTLPRFINNTHLVTLDTELELTDAIMWSVNAGYQVTKQKQNYPLPNTEVSVPGYISQARLTLPPKTLTIDTRISSTGDGPFDWMIGGYWQQFNSVSTLFSQDADIFVGLPFAPVPLAFAPPTNAVSDLVIPIRKDAYAVFGSVRYNVTDSLRVEAGLRYNWFSFDQQSFFSYCLPDLGVCPVDNIAAYGPDLAKRTNEALTGGASVSFDITPDVTTYISYGRSYRAPAAQNGAALSGIIDPALLLSRPEKSDAFEAGVRAKMLDGRVNLSISGFYQKYKDYLAYIASLNARDFQGSITSIPSSTNGDAISKGVEFQVSGRISDNFDLGLSGSYVDAHYDNATLPCNQTDPATGAAFIPAGQTVATCVRNDRIAQVPKFTATINGEIRFPTGSVTPFVRWLANYRPGFNSIQDDYKYRDIVNVNLYLGVRGDEDRWELSLFAKNLLNQARATIVSNQQLQQSTTVFDPVTFAPLGPGAPILSGYRTAVITPPREFGLTARFKW
jgi:Outer membrane receptor proteins, mostly Fe transport